MAVNSNSSSCLLADVYLKGVLQNHRGEFVSKGKFHLYDEAEKFLAFGKTSKDGTFQVKLRNRQQDQNISLIFRLCEEKIPPEIASELNHRVSKDLSSILHLRSEIEEAKKTFPLQGTELDLGNVAMNISYNTEKVPASYLVDVASAGIVAKIRGIRDSLLHAVDFLNLQQPDSIQTVYGVSSIPLTSESTWKMLTNGICPIYFKNEDNCLMTLPQN